MTIQELLIELQRLHVRLSSEDGKLKVTAPKGALTPELQRAMAAQKAELLAYVRSAGASPGGVDGPVPVARAGRLPLSFTQERLWFLQQLAPSSTAYHIVNAFRLAGPLDVDAVARSWAAVCNRHEVLRTRVSSEDGRPFVVVDETTAPGTFARVDCSNEPAAAREQTCARLIGQEASRVFDLERGPLAVLTLVTLDEHEHLAILIMHHIVADQWSMQLLARDLAALYNHAVGSAPLVLPELPVQYVDYAAWQRAWLDGDVWERELGYWRAQLDGVPTLNLLTDRPRPAVAEATGARVRVPLGAAQIERISALALQSGTTPFTIFLAGFALLLHRYTSQTDLPIATPIANRRRSDLEQVVGAFINTLVLRLRTDADPTCADFLERVRHVTLDAFEHQDAPFERLVAALHPARDPSQAPLAQVMFNLVSDTVGAAAAFSGIAAEPVPVERHDAMFDLTFIVRLGADPVVVAEYRSDLFESSTMERMLVQYVSLLDQMTSSPHAKLSDVDLVTEPERALMAGWNATAAPYDLEEGVEHLVAAQARRTPDAVAVVCGRRSLSYAELESRSATLAAYLQNRDLGPESLVGVCLERSPDLVVALLGILKAGAAYVPLDPAFPPQRLAVMVEDSTLSLIITDDASEAVLPENDAALLRIDLEWDRVAAAPARGAPSVTGNHLAYVLYTSGSTGRPKGVQVPRSAFTNFIRSMQHEPGIAVGDVLLAVTTLSFDIAGLELFLPLTVGGTVVLATREQASDGLDLAELMASCRASMMQATPATWRLLLDSGWPGSAQLTALCGGEPLPRELSIQLLEKTRALWNMYGPTETTVWSTLEKVLPGERITVGHPIANTQVHVVDERLRLVPIGVPGELCIGGDGVARGYLGRPDLTAEKFVTDLFASAERRMYRTGDLARWLADGRLELLGRADQQVKVRGFRIELGEIEGVLERHEAVRQAVASVYDDGAGDKRLVAYLVYEAGADTTPSELRRFLRGDLPDYMVPSLFVELPALPLTANGKVDRKALPPPLEPQRKAGERVAPRTDMERLIAGLWRDAVGTQDVSVHDNFFDIGGHSLLSMQVIARLEKEVGVRLQPARFIIDSLEQLSAACEQMLAKTPVAAAGPRSETHA